jgi:para-nitrobenzyl esterase
MSGVVLVSANHRLGVEGFAQIPGAPANRGLLDQVAVLRWVRENIEAFGGDPQNVTVFGESAGAGSIAALLAMDGTARQSTLGLFRRAITQSVPGTFFGADLAGEITLAIAAEAGVPATYEGLSGVSPADLAAASAKLTARLGELRQLGPVASTVTPFSPVVDGEVLPRAPWRALLAGAGRDVELLTGHNADEYRLFVAMAGQLGNVTEDLATATLATFGPGADGPDRYRDMFPDASAGELHELVQSDWLFRMPTLHLAQAHAASGGRTFLYELRASAPANGGMFGACHGLDVPLIFGTAGEGIGALLAGPEPAGEFLALGDLMREDWTRFARCGDPGWPAYGTEQRTTRIYDLRPDIAPYPEEKSMRLWQRHRFDTLHLAG